MILEVIARARRRLLWNAVAVEGARAVCFSLGILVLLLLLGTDVLDWRYLLFIPTATIVAGTCRNWRRIPDRYQAAQILDRRLGLQDALSTALYYRPGHTSRKADEGMREAQHAQAVSLASSVDLRNALPLRMPRLIYTGAALALIGGGLVGLRYRVQGGLNLRAPATPSIALLLQSVTEQVASLEEWLKQLQPELQSRDQRTEQAKLSEKDASGSDAKSPTDTGRGEEAGAEKQDSKMASDDPPEGKRDTTGDQQAESEGNSSEQSDQPGQQGKQGEQGRDQRSSASQEASGGASESSLLNKVRDTMANLLSAMKPQPGGGEGRAEANRNPPRKDGKSGSADRQQDAPASPSQAEERGDGSQAQKNASGSAAQADSAGADKQKGAGAGHDEGDKELRLAEQRDAMGKISMILGKRSKDVTGAASMEVVSGEQTLQTRYENRQTKHVGVEDTGDRDEVPIELQDYVRQYLQAAKAAGSRVETPATKQK